MSKFKKIDKEYLLTDSSVNSYGFRLMTNGYQIDEFKKNAIGYHMHDRPAGVLLKWEDLRVDGDSVYGKPVINMAHPRAAQTVDEVENGFLNAASVGHLVVLDCTDEPAMKLPGQNGPTVTKWFNRECSLVDIPGNFNALTLFDENENPLNLSDLTKTNLNMKIPVVTAAMFAAMNLNAASDEAAVEARIIDLAAKAGKVDALAVELANLKSQVGKDKVAEIIASALAAKKVTKELADKLAADYATNPDGLKSLVDAMPAYSPITNQLGSDKKWGEDLASKSWSEIMDMDKMADLKAKNFELYKTKFKEEFGHEPKI